MFRNKFYLYFIGVKNEFSQVDFDLVKYVTISLVLTGVSFFLIIRVLGSIEEGYYIEDKLNALSVEVKNLEEENAELRNRRDFFASGESLELQYRSLGYVREGEIVYFFSSGGDVSKGDLDKDVDFDRGKNTDSRPVILQWLGLIF